MAWDDVYFSKLFIAVPELVFEERLVKYLKKRGIIDDVALEAMQKVQNGQKKYGKIIKRLRGKGLIQRLMVLSPELINRDTVALFHRFGLIDSATRDMLNLVMRTSGLAIGRRGVTTSFEQLLRRAKYVFGVGYADDLINLMRDTGAFDPKTASILKSSMRAVGVFPESIENLRRAKKWTDVMMVIGSGLVDVRTINLVRSAGLIDNRTANALLESLKYGSAQWTVWEGAKRAEGLAARLAYVVSGSFSWEAVDVLTAISKMSKGELERIGLGWLGGKIQPWHLDILKIAVSASQEMNRNLMEQMTKRRYRVVPGEPPIKTFARSAKETDAALLRLLARSADDAAARARLLAGAARGAEYNLRARELHRAMRQVWEGTGYLTIFGEHKVADAALDAELMLQKRLYRKFPASVQTMLEYQARSGLDSFISRQENTLPLSRRVVKNYDLWTKKMDTEISVGLLQGQSADEIARRVRSMINPSVMGGVKYASMRIGRTEVANAFHLTTIRTTREQPWVRGYKWNLSGSHGKPDVCNEYAEDDHDSLGAGVFKKVNVPGKPHPQCLCYLTVVSMSDSDFISAYNKGRFNQYFQSAVSSPGVQDYMTNNGFSNFSESLGRIGTQAAVTAGLGLVMSRVA